MRQKGFAHLILLLVIGVALVGGYALYTKGYINLNPNTNTTSVSPTSYTTITPTSTKVGVNPALDEMASWEVYTDAKVNFTFKYPDSVSLELKNDARSIILTEWGPTQKKETEFYDALRVIFEYGDLNGKSLEQQVDADIKKGSEIAEIIKTKQATTFNGLSGFTYTSNELGTNEYIYLKHPSKQIYVRIINATSDPTNQGFQNTAGQILSTFKFTD